MDTRDTRQLAPVESRHEPMTGIACRWFDRMRHHKLSPINQRRWHNFKANRRGYWSLMVFLAAVLRVSLFAEFIANDSRILVALQG